MPDNKTRRTSHPATCEDFDEVAQTIRPDTQTSANVAAKRSKPELLSTHGSTSTAGNLGAHAKSVRTDKNVGNAPPSRQARMSSGLSIDTSSPLERRRQPYASGPAAERPRHDVNRSASKPPKSKTENARTGTGHEREAPSQQYDTRLYYTTKAAETKGLSRDRATPQLPSAGKKASAKHISAVKDKTALLAAQSRPVRTQSYDGQRPKSFHPSMSTSMPPELYPQGPSFSNAQAWQFTPSPISGYSPGLPYPQIVSPAASYAHQGYQHPIPPSSHVYSQLPIHPSIGHAEYYQNPPIYGDRTIQGPLRQGRVRTASRERLHPRHASRSREADARRMPPPQNIPGVLQPSMAKANTTMPSSNSRSLQRTPSDKRSGPKYTSHEEYTAREESTPHARPAPHRDPPPSAYLNTGPSRPRRSSSSRSNAGRRGSYSYLERDEADVEAYQQNIGTEQHALTVDAMRKMSLQYNSSSQQSRNSDSRGSSGGITKTTGASNDLMISMPNGLSVNVPADGNENRSFTIQPKSNGGVSVSIDEQEPRSGENRTRGLAQGAGASTTSSSRRSHRGSCEVKPLRGQSPDRSRRPSINTSSKSGRASRNNSPGYGINHG